MENITRPRRGRPRKNLDIPQPIEEGESASCLDNGDGETGGIGTHPQANDVRPGTGWASFSRWIESLTYQNVHIRVAYHPEPLHNVIHGNWNVTVEVGEPAYMTKDGQRVMQPL
jgi:hypothetical protein